MEIVAAIPWPQQEPETFGIRQPRHRNGAFRATVQRLRGIGSETHVRLSTGDKILLLLDLLSCKQYLSKNQQ